MSCDCKTREFAWSFISLICSYIEDIYGGIFAADTQELITLNKNECEDFLFQQLDYVMFCWLEACFEQEENYKNME